MDKADTETVEHLKAGMEELLHLADRLDLPVVGAWLASAIDQIPKDAANR